MTKNTIFIFITGLHKKPQGCGAPVASAAGPFSIKEKNPQPNLMLILLTLATI
jgi:hypothetical protein